MDKVLIGYIVFGLFCLYLIVAPKSDARFKTGYVGNAVVPNIIYVIPFIVFAYLIWIMWPFVIDILTFNEDSFLGFMLNFFWEAITGILKLIIVVICIISGSGDCTFFDE
tara:strand:+ start:261 stop:590 length:330 start_codon:yes stop_codon:yes gene_type:complete